MITDKFSFQPSIDSGVAILSSTGKRSASVAELLNDPPEASSISDGGDSTPMSSEKEKSSQDTSPKSDGDRKVTGRLGGGRQRPKTRPSSRKSNERGGREVPCAAARSLCGGGSGGAGCRGAMAARANRRAFYSPPSPLCVAAREGGREGGREGEREGVREGGCGGGGGSG